MRRGSIAAIFFVLCLLVSLRGGVEVEHQTFIVSMGVDSAPGGVTVTLVLPSANAGNQSEEKGGGAYEIVSASGAAFDDALLVLRATIPRELNFSQLLQIVVAEPLARGETFGALLDAILSTPRLNQSATLAVSRSAAETFLRQQLPFLGVRLSAGIETSLTTYGELGNIPSAMLGPARREMAGGWRTPLLPLVSVNAGQDDASIPSGEPLAALAGQLPHRGGIATEYLGAAVVADGRMRGALTGAQMQLVSFLMGEMKEIPFSVGGEYCRLRQRGKPAVSVSLRDGVCSILLCASADAFPQGGAPVNAQAVQEKLTASVREVLSLLCAMGADPVGFEGFAVRGVASLSAWDGGAWASAYRRAQPEAEIAVVAADTL